MRFGPWVVWSSYLPPPALTLLPDPAPPASTYRALVSPPRGRTVSLQGGQGALPHLLGPRRHGASRRGEAAGPAVGSLGSPGLGPPGPIWNSQVAVPAAPCAAGLGSLFLWQKERCFRASSSPKPAFTVPQCWRLQA